jgi:Zn-dependent protease with chaperone function
MTGFFEQQELARRNTRVMVVLFLLAVVAVVLAVDAVIAAAYISVNRQLLLPGMSWWAMLGQVPYSVYAWGALGTAGLIFVVSTVNVTRLGKGGSAVAEMAGARRVPAETKDPLERRLLNVVEEMAIASGVRVPAVYVMDAERGINAFAAGWDVSSAVVAVTRGALETLTRDELQGVIAHEFSHILNGDMRLNIRMMGVLAGIVFIGAAGRFLMRSLRGSRNRRGGGQLALAGLALFLVGWIGLIFARLIKSAVSREREFLADASSVQFTRNPDGLAGALDQIRSASAGALIESRHAEAISHMFFGQAVRMRLAGLFDTHPPLDERIRRVRPGFQPAKYRQTRPLEAPPAEALPTADIPVAGLAASPVGRRADDAAHAWGRTAGQSAQLVGTLDAQKIDYAARLLGLLPARLRDAVREPASACATAIALLLAPREEVMEEQLAALRSAGIVTLAERARVMREHTRNLGEALRLPVLDLALPAMKGASKSLKRELLTGLEVVVHADRRVALREFVVLTFVRAQVSGERHRVGGRRMAALREEARLLLWMIAAGGRNADPRKAFDVGARHLGFNDAAPVQGAAMSLASATEALEALRELAPAAKEELVGALFAASTADGSVSVTEAELLRLACAVLDCPLPPLLDDLPI